ncbi:hypothetical protein [Phyllobacterium myrsinacearum]|uniref:Uncharacterized protein n=1 Tax=Phyllobacterium myrsinacearum TaxID=28101 RepID=A0A839EFK0_9HYPH|nr:hypothetical protein [Phyllobacterium myrsinacearum]MBA8876384.1 hypothetical protein [Phyllobacterium myrsinacearum]
MTDKIGITDGEAYELAANIADTQKAKLPEQLSSQISEGEMQIGETWFVWGIFAALTDDRKRRQKLLSDYLANKIRPDTDIQKIVTDITALESEGNQLFNAISSAGRQAYHEDDDVHLSKIAGIFLNVIKNH